MSAPSPLLATLYVALGGGTGAVLRYQTGRGVTHLLGRHAVDAFPWPTLTVNVLGSLLMGVLAGWLARHGGEGPIGGESWRLLLGVGVLGGFTTFSSFSMEMMLLIERGQAAQAVLYATVSLLAGLSALYIGLLTMRVTA